MEKFSFGDTVGLVDTNIVGVPDDVLEERMLIDAVTESVGDLVFGPWEGFIEIPTLDGTVGFVEKLKLGVTESSVDAAEVGDFGDVLESMLIAVVGLVENFVLGLWEGLVGLMTLDEIDGFVDDEGFLQIAMLGVPDGALEETTFVFEAVKPIEDLVLRLWEGLVELPTLGDPDDFMETILLGDTVLEVAVPDFDDDIVFAVELAEFSDDAVFAVKLADFEGEAVFEMAGAEVFVVDGLLLFVEGLTATVMVEGFSIHEQRVLT